MNADNARRMKKINEEYFTPRDTNLATVSFSREGDVLDFIPEDVRRYAVGNGLPNIANVLNSKVAIPSIGFRFSGGRLKII